MRWLHVLLGLAVAAIVPAAGHAQTGNGEKLQIGIAPHISTMGVGVDVAAAAHPRVNLRGGANVFPIDFDVEASDVDLSINFPSPTFTLLVDLFPAGGFRLTGGILISPNDFSGEARVTQSVEIGNNFYSASEIGSLTASIVTRDIAPYIGIGVGNVASRGAGFFFDLGLAFKGSPEVQYTATGPIASTPEFQADLNLESQDVEEDSFIEIFAYYPVISLGFSIGF